MIDNHTNKRFIYGKTFNRILEIALKNAKIKGETEVSLIIVHNQDIKDLSKKYKQVDLPTDVLSFRADWKKLYPLVHINILGDIVISRDKVEQQAKLYGHSLQREWSYLFTHGLIHLLGYDHETKKDEKVMNDIVEKIMTEIGVPRKNA